MGSSSAEKIAKALLQTKSVYINIKSPFRLTSGKRSVVYVDCRRLISYPDLRKVITAEFVRIAKGIDIDVIAGGETAGIAYAAFLADKLKKPMIYVRKQPKGHGKASQVEGVLRKGERVLLVEDLVTDGKSKLIFKEGIEACGGVMEHCLCIFEYYSKQAGLHLAKERLAERGVKLHSLITWDDILRVGLAKGYITEEECDHILRFLKDF